MAESSDIYHDYRVQKEAISLSQAGYQVHVYGFRARLRTSVDADLPFKVTTLPVASRRCRVLRNLSMALNIALINLVLVARRADCYHAHNTMFLVGMLVGSRLHGGRFVYDAHEVQWEKGWMARTLERLFIRRADAVISVAPGRAREMARRHGIPEGRITIISNYPVFDSSLALEPTRAASGPLQLVFSGGYEIRSNRLDNLLRAMATVPGLDLNLMAFGYRDGEAVMRRLVREHALEQRVRFLPLVKPHEVMGAISRYDVAVNLLTNPNNHLSIRHPSVNKMYEYLAAGLPIFCSDLEGFLEEFVQEGAAIAVAADRVEAVADGLRRLLDQRSELSRMRERALDLARRRYNWKTQEEKLVSLYRSLTA